MTKQGRGLWALAFLVSVAFLPGVIDPAMSVRWAVLAVGPVIFLLYRHWYVGSWYANAYLILAAVSVLWCPDEMDGIEELVHLIILAGCFLLGIVAEDLKPAWRGLAAGISVSAVIAVAQWFGFTGIDQVAPPAGLFMNRNMLAEAGMVALIPMMLAGSWLLTVGPFVAVLIGGSKAVLAGLIAVMVVESHGMKRAVILLMASVGALLWATLGSHASFDSRVFIWDYISSDIEWFGHGIGGVSTALPYVEYPHSEFLGWVYEYGVYAVIPMALLWDLLRRVHYGPERLILIALCVVGIVAFPFHLPLTGFAAALAAGHLVKFGVVVRRYRGAAAGGDPRIRTPYAGFAPGGAGAPGGSGVRSVPAGSAFATPATKNARLGGSDAARP